jgi:uncharacterized protein YgbK (DUF1537 family)
LLIHADHAAELPKIEGLSAVLSGSCSTATNGQVEEWLRSRPGFRIDPLGLAQGSDLAGEAIAWAGERIAAGPVLVYATSAPEQVARVQARLGAERAGQLVEACLARVARELVERGVRRLVVAGGETSGAVVSALGVRALRIGRQIDPGVPWTASVGGAPLALALKSGNFGGQDFFARALAMLDGVPP